MQINESIGAARKYLQGKKTLFCCMTGGLYVLGVWLGFWEWDERVLAMFGLGGLAFLRVALVAKTNTDTHGQSQTGTNGTPTNIIKLPLLMVLPMMLALASGCTAPRDVAGKTLVTTVQSVDAAMQGWGAWVRAGQASAQDEAKVKAFYERYQMAELAAEKAYEAWCASPHGATGEQSAWTTAAAALRAAQKDLLAVLDRTGQQTERKK